MQSKATITNAASIMRNGGLIVHPTDTICGIACDILSPSAVERIYKVKKRERSKPLILLVSSIEMMKNYIQDIHPRIETLLSHHKRPLTVIYLANKNVPSYLITPEGTIGIRVVHHELTKSLIESLGRPITSTSANVSGEPFPGSCQDLSKEISSNVDLVIDNSNENHSTNRPSIVIRFDDKGDIELLRS